jgi:hypothetical protein
MRRVSGQRVETVTARPFPNRTIHARRRQGRTERKRREGRKARGARPTPPPFYSRRDFFGPRLPPRRRRVFVREREVPWPPPGVVDVGTGCSRHASARGFYFLGSAQEW